MILKPKVYGLTGGMGTGKSTVAKMFERLGAYTIDADQLSREITEPLTPGWQKLREAFGKSYFNDRGELDRKKLGALIFSDPKKRKELEAITHPLIREAIRQKIKTLSDQNVSLVMVEAALMMETGYDQEFQGTLVVGCKAAIQQERLLKRDRLSPSEIKNRLRAQWPLEKKMKRATFVIDNSGSLLETKKEVKVVYKKILARKERVPWH